MTDPIDTDPLAGFEPYALDADQEIRARALDVAAYVIGDVSGTVAGVAQHLIDLAEPLVPYIRTGQRPGTATVCFCSERQRPERDCPAHGTRAEP